MISVIISLLSLLFLAFLHELFHFIFAKKYKVPVEELGIGFPPRLWQKKIQETIYSINLLPLGGFVKINEEAFKKANFKVRAWTILAGCFSFWIIAYFLFSINALIGMPISGDFSNNKKENTFIMITNLANHSPAFQAGLKIGDKILSVKSEEKVFNINSIKQFQDLIEEYKGKEITIEVLRGKNILSFQVIPRLNPPPNEGRLGIVMDEVFIKKSPFLVNFWDGLIYTIKYTILISQTYADTFLSIFQKEKTEGLTLVGPIGFIHFSSTIFSTGLNYFLNFLGTASISLSLFNLLPIPVTDGGRLFLILIEKMRGKKFSLETEERIIGFSFFIIVILAIIISIKDIQRIF